MLFTVRSFVMSSLRRRDNTEYRAALPKFHNITGVLLPRKTNIRF